MRWIRIFQMFFKYWGYFIVRKRFLYIVILLLLNVNNEIFWAFFLDKTETLEVIEFTNLVLNQLERDEITWLIWIFGLKCTEKKLWRIISSLSYYKEQSETKRGKILCYVVWWINNFVQKKKFKNTRISGKARKFF